MRKTSSSLERNNLHFQQERQRLDQWADDIILASENDLKDTKNKIKMVKRDSRAATTMKEQLEAEKQLQQLNRQLRRQRQRIFDLEDEIMERRDRLIEDLEKRIARETHHEILFMLRFTVT